MLACGCWSLGHGASLLATTLRAKIQFSWFWYMGAASAAWALLLFAIQYERQERRVPLRRIMLASISPLATCLLVWTGDWQHIFWIRTYLDTSGPFPLFGIDHGPAFYLSLASSDSAALAAMVLLLRLLWARSARGKKDQPAEGIPGGRLYRRQAALLTAGILVALLTNTVYVTGHSPLFSLDFTPLSLIVCGSLIAMAVFGQRLLEIVPIAYRFIVEGMSDPVIVVDPQHRVVYANGAAWAFGQWAGDPLGQPLGAVAPEIAEIVAAEDQDRALRELERGLGPARRVYDVRVSGLRNQAGEACGRAIVLRDVTEHRLVGELRHSRRQIIAAEENLRRQIADMLHGTVQAKLLNAWLRLGDYQQRWEISDQAFEELTPIRDALDRIREEDLRLASHLLHPSIIRVGLIPAIENLLSGYESAFRLKLNVDESVRARDVIGGPGINHTVRLTAYRFIEEGLNNAVKHARAERVRVSLGIAGEYLEVAIQDDGTGFDPAQAVPGLGLDGIAGRVEQMAGTWLVDSAPGRGTTLRARLPLDVEDPQPRRFAVIPAIDSGRAAASTSR